ncbi:MAG TPA: YpdA family putative bacillithiol disulfide reductase [Longimicrobiales bacterium]
MQDTIEIAVIGAGPCGLGVGVAAAQAGVACTIIEKGCITRCIAGYPTYGSFFSTADKLELGGLPFITTADRPTRREALKYYRRVVAHFGLDVRQYEEVVAVAREPDGAFRVRTRRADGTAGEFRAAHVVDATGYWDHPNLLGVPGEELPKVSHYYGEGLPYYGQDVLVVGGGNSAVEAALDLFRSGARVTLVHFLDALDGGVKPWVLPDIQGRLRNGEIQARFRHRVAEIRPGSVLLRSEADGRVETLKNDFVFAMTGYTPDPWILRGLGVTIDPETGIPAHDPATMETDVPGVFLAGVVAGGNRPNKIFIETGREHGPRIVRAVLSASASAPGAPAR